MNDEQDTLDMNNNFTMGIVVTGVQVINDVDVNTITKLAQGSVFNSKIKSLAPSVDAIKSFEKSATKPNLESMGDRNIISVSTSKSPVYAWFDSSNGAVYYWSEDSHIYWNENASEMFKDLTGIISIDTVNFDTSKVTNMSYLFKGCYSLTEINVSTFDVSNVTSMRYMFAGETAASASKDTRMKIKNIIGLTSFDTSKVTNMSYMFYVCTELNSIDLSCFNTSNVTTMQCMFAGSMNQSTYNMGLTEIKGIENFDTSKVRNMSQMFYMCVNLKGLNLSNFNTENVTDMAEMFVQCRNIETLDLSSFNTKKVANMKNMFLSCYKLTTIYASDTFDTNIAVSTSMFNGAINLKGGNGTTYSAEHTDKGYARIDTETTPGYFTLKTE